MMRASVFILALCVCSQFCAWEVKGEDVAHVASTVHQDCWEKREVLTSCFFDPQARYICCTQTKRWGLDCSTTVRRPFETSTVPTCTVDDASPSSTSSPSLPLPSDSPIEPPLPMDSPVEPLLPADSPVSGDSPPATGESPSPSTSGDSPPATSESPSPSTSGDSPPATGKSPSPSTPRESPVEPPVEQPVEPSPPPTSNGYDVPTHPKEPPVPATKACEPWSSVNTTKLCRHGTCNETRESSGVVCVDGVPKPYGGQEKWTVPDPNYKQYGRVYLPILSAACQPSSESFATKRCSQGSCCETVEEQGIKCVHGRKRPYQNVGQPNCYKSA